MPPDGGDRDSSRQGRIYDARLMRRLLRYVRPYRAIGAFGLGLVFAAAGLVILGPVVIRAIIDDGIAAGAPDTVVLLALAYLGVEALRFFAEYSQMYTLQKLGQLSMRDLRKDLFRHLQTLPLSFYERNRVGRIVTRTTNDIQSLSELFSAGLVTLFRDVLLVIGISVALLALNWRVGIVTLSAAPVVAFAVRYFRRYLRAAYRRVRAAVSQLNATMQENLNGVRVAQLLGLEEDRHARYRRDNDEFRDALIGSVRTHAVFAPFISMASALALALVFWYGGGQALHGAITLGTLVAFIELMPHLITPIRDMGEKFTILQSAFAAAERIFEVMDTPAGIVDRPGSEGLPDPKGGVELRDVRFGYLDGRPVLHGLSLAIRPGERVAVVGRTGSGKTTLSRLVARFYDPWEGQVRLDGRDLRELRLRDLRRSLAVVNQDVFVFGGSVLENVRMGDPSISREAVILACRWANAHTFIEQWPDGYDHELAEGGRDISLGQRQLLSFARALVRQPAVLVLDEATASVDTRTERLITEATDRITRGRTAIVIAHRLATVRNADRIVVVEDGRIIEDGSPSELLRENGFFKRLHALQFDGDGRSKTSSPG